MAESIQDRKLGITKEMRSYMKVHNFTMVIRQGEFGLQDENSRAYTEAGDLGIQPIWLGIYKRTAKTVVELTGMTSEELALFKRAMLEAIEAAEPVVAWLDENAQDEFDDDTPLIPLRALKGAPPCVIRPIQPFAGSHLDPSVTCGDGPSDTPDPGLAQEPAGPERPQVLDEVGPPG